MYEVAGFAVYEKYLFGMKLCVLFMKIDCVVYEKFCMV